MKYIFLDFQKLCFCKYCNFDCSALDPKQSTGMRASSQISRPGKPGTDFPPLNSEQVLEDVHAEAAGVPVLALGHAPAGPTVPGRLHKLHGLVGEGSLHELDGVEEGQHVLHLGVLYLTSACSADHPLVAVLDLKGGKSLDGRDLSLLSRPLASPGEQVASDELGLDAQDSDSSEGGGLGCSEGEDGGGAGGEGDGVGAGGGGHLLEQDQGDGQGHAEQGAEHLVLSS